MSVRERDIRALEALAFVNAEYGIQLRKPCVAYLLDGNTGAADRHAVAFVIGVALRELGLNEVQVEQIVNSWAMKVGYNARKTHRCARDAFKRKPDGSFRYPPPGRVRRPGTRYFEVLEPICRDVGCPENCPAFASTIRGERGETYEKFERLGWPTRLRQQRAYAAIEVYKAICEREKQLHLAPGSELIVTHERLAQTAGINRRTVGRNLPALQLFGLITYLPGAGSGPRARDRAPSRVQRVTPIPNPQEHRGFDLSIPAIQNGGHGAPR